MVKKPRKMEITKPFGNCYWEGWGEVEPESTLLVALQNDNNQS